MTSLKLREKFLAYFKNKGHAIIPSASLVPEHDPTVLFTTAGMHPLVPYLVGEKHPQGKRLVDVQKCIRTGDIDSVGDAWHLTFFEMLGNWSLGDYFKEEAIAIAWEFLTEKKWLGIDPDRLSVSVFAGDQDAPRDQEAAEIWEKVGIPKARIYYYPKAENWWGPAGETGPCGPDTEIFFDTGRARCRPGCEPKCSCGKYAEIWNLVFMQYDKKVKSQKSKVKNAIQNSKIGETKTIYEYIPLKQKNIDTGMGLERTIAILNGQDNVYATDLFAPVIHKIKDLVPAEKSFSPRQTKSIRIIADHLRAAIFILGDGVKPSNLDQGYVLRRLIRRAVRHAKLLGIPQDKNLTRTVAVEVIDSMGEQYPELKQRSKNIILELEKEEKKFESTLVKGLKQFEKMIDQEMISGQDAFFLFQSYGFPLEIIQELAQEHKINVDVEGFNQEFKKHQAVSRKGAAQKFKGGLADASKKTVKYHTATHLLHQALCEVLGEHVKQQGSNITPERLRFDFSHPEKMTEEQILKVEKIVNAQINARLPVKVEEITLEDARRRGAIGLFENKYGDRVKVYSIGGFSQEICGGPHVKNTRELGKFKIIKEESSGAGVRRIKAKLIKLI